MKIPIYYAHLKINLQTDYAIYVIMSTNIHVNQLNNMIFITCKNHAIFYMNIHAIYYMYIKSYLLHVYNKLFITCKKHAIYYM